MKKLKRITIIGVTVLAVIVGLRLLATRLPVKLEGPAWNSIENCAENQKKLYQSIERHLKEHGTLPNKDFEINGWRARDTWKCPACERGYVLHLENYGNPRTVAIADQQDTHPTTFMWWFRGLKPQVQTMGDGTIHLFQDGRVLTMVGGSGSE